MSGWFPKSEMFSLMFRLMMQDGGNKEDRLSTPKDAFKQLVTAYNTPGHKVQFKSCIFSAFNFLTALYISDKCFYAHRRCN